VVTVAQACVMLPFAVSTSKLGATLMLGKTVKTQMILLYNVWWFIMVVHLWIACGFLQNTKDGGLLPCP